MYLFHRKSSLHIRNDLFADSLEETPPIGNDYYEGILFSDGIPKQVSNFPPPPSEAQPQIPDEEYEDVEVNQLFDPVKEPPFESHPCPQYENLPNGHATPSFKQQQQQEQQDLDAMLFSVGLRFPSIRIKDEEKRRAKKERNDKTGSEPVYSQPDKTTKRQSSVDIYDVVKNDLTKSTSTLRAEQKAKFALSERKSRFCSLDGIYSFHLKISNGGHSLMTSHKFTPNHLVHTNKPVFDLY